MTNNTEIRTATDTWAQAMRNDDLQGIIKHYAADIVAYDAVKQLQFVGIDAYRKHWDYCLKACPGAMTFEIKDLVTHAENETAFSFFLCRCGGTDESGEEKSSWMRVTRGLRKIDGVWLTVHEHFSSPFDMESGMALFDLQP